MMEMPIMMAVKLCDRITGINPRRSATLCLWCLLPDKSALVDSFAIDYFHQRIDMGQILQAGGFGTGGPQCSDLFERNK
jgi:hypothetical protein